MNLRNTPASQLDWDDIAHFTKDEWQGHLAETSALLVTALDLYRTALDAPVYISPANWGTHGETSYHIPTEKHGNKYCWAVDIFPDCDLAWAYHIAMRCKCFGAVGVYPSWLWQDKNLAGGLHLDIRHYATMKTVWWRDEQNKYNYLRKYVDLANMELEMLMCSNEVTK